MSMWQHVRILTHVCGLIIKVCVTGSPEADCFSPLSSRFFFFIISSDLCITEFCALEHMQAK